MRASSLWVAGGAVGGGMSIGRSAHAHGTDVIKIGLIGCGGRGTAAAVEALNTSGDPLRLVAMADVFGDKIQGAFRRINSAHADKIDVSRDRRFVGFDAYKGVLGAGVDLVILATPPAFRPLQFEAAVDAGKHVFLETPVAVDAAGVRRVLAANARAKQANLAVAVGLQRRHEDRYRQTIAQLRSGLIGEIVTLRVYWNEGAAEIPNCRPGQAELEYQLRHWGNFGWLGGDPIVARHIHNLDVANWLMNACPTEVNAQGGHAHRHRDELGSGPIFDHFFCEYTYAGGAKMFSQCRNANGCWRSVSEHAHGTRGYADISGGKIYSPAGAIIWQAARRPQGYPKGHQQEHHDLFAALRAGQVPNEGDYGAKSTMTAIMGRLAAHSGRRIAWNDAINLDDALANVDALQALDDAVAVAPDVHRDYPAAAGRATGITAPTDADG